MRTRYFSLALLVLGMAGGIAFADEVRGVIAKVDTGKNEIVVDVRSRAARGVTMTFAIDPDIRIQIGRQAAAMTDLQPGERARLWYETRNGRRIAVAITAYGARKNPEPPLRADAPPPGDANTVTGILRRIALTDREIVVIGPGSKGEAETETTITVPDKIAITRAGKGIHLEDLKEDEQVAVPVEKRAGKLLAKSIQVGAGAVAQAPSAAPKTRIERLRRVLQLADWFLEQMENEKKESKP